MTRRFLLPLLLITSILLSGCQLPGRQQAATSTEEVIDGTSWRRQGDQYTATLEYSSPGGQELNKFHLTIKNGTITAASVEVLTQIDASIVYQQQFAKELPPLLIGKKLSSIAPLPHLSGASLTTAAFNDALKQLQSKL